MIQFQVSAPGKIILFGEHSVVYGKTALTASLNVRTQLELQELPKPENNIRVVLKRVDLDKSVPTERVEHLLSSLVDEEALLPQVEKFVDGLGHETDSQKLAQVALFYLLARIFRRAKVLKVTGFETRVSSSMSIGSGLGSSAAYAVCLAAGFGHYCRVLKNEDLDLNESRLREISEDAFEAEKIMHGNPSGLDNTICTFGSMIEFRKNAPVNVIPFSKKLRVMLVDTKVQRSTKALVQRVAGNKEQYPDIFQRIFEAMDDVAKEAAKVIRESDGDEDYCNKLSGLARINQGLLYSCGVSHEVLDTICIAAKKFGFSAKLTGAGGGGCAFIFIPDDASKENIQNLGRELARAELETSLTTLGGDGVIIN